MTEWRDIPGHEGVYQVSDDGQVRSLDRAIMRKNGMPQTFRGKPLKLGLTWNGRLRVMLDRPKNYLVHRLVMLAFVGPCPDGMEVCHNDGNPLNNKLGNLRYDTPSENMMDEVRSGRHHALRKTHCPKGHPYSGDNLWYENKRAPGHRNPVRRCKACTAEFNRRGRERRAYEKAAA